MAARGRALKPTVAIASAKAWSQSPWEALVPVSGPWLKFSDVADYLRAVEPERAYWIHDALLNDKGANLWQNLLGLAPARSGPASFLVPGTSVEL